MIFEAPVNLTFELQWVTIIDELHIVWVCGSVDVQSFQFVVTLKSELLAIRNLDNSFSVVLTC